MTKGYQIMCEGYTSLGEKNKINSKRIYLNPPTEEEKEVFIKKCSTPLNDFDFSYIKTISRILIIEVEIG